MNQTDLTTHLSHLNTTYVSDADVAKELLGLLTRDPIPAKAILASLSPYFAGTITPADEQVLQDIVYYYV
ncbi:hypothetical protein [Chitinimonas naiadis]